jgi:hypothetical protein
MSGPDLPRAHSNFERNPTQTQFFEFRLTPKKLSLNGAQNKIK